MKKIIAFSAFFSACGLLFGQKNKKEEDKKPRDFAITTAGDTVFGKMGPMISWSRWNGTSFNLYTKDDVKTKYDRDNAKTVRKDGDVYDLLPLHPREADSKKDFMKVMMRNTKATLYLFGPLAGGTDEDYYLYENGVFVSEVKKKNHSELIQKYFGDCAAIQSAFGEKDNWFGKMYTLSERFMKECRKQ